MCPAKLTFDPGCNFALVCDIRAGIVWTYATPRGPIQVVQEKPDNHTPKGHWDDSVYHDTRIRRSACSIAHDRTNGTYACLPIGAKKAEQLRRAGRG